MLRTPPARGDGFASPIPSMAPARVLTRLGPGPTALVVGYPAPAAQAIVDRLLATDERTIACVVSRHDWDAAARRHRDAQGTGRLRLFEGSAAKPGLGLACTAWRLLDTADEIYCAAPAEEVALRHVHDFADECPRLRHLHIVAPTAGGGRVSLRRRLGALLRPAPLAASVRSLARGVAAGVAGFILMAPLAARPWKTIEAMDLEAMLTWEDLEHDLRLGVSDGN